MSQEFWPRVVHMSKDLNKNRLSSLVCFFLSYVVPKPIYDHFMSLIGTGLFFLWAFCKLGFSHPGKGYRFCAVLVWNPGSTPCNGLYTEAPPKGVHFLGFRKGMFASSSCKLQRPGIKVWHDSDRASISPSDSIRPVADPDLQIREGGVIQILR